MRNKGAYGGNIHGEKETADLGNAPGYEVMLVEILEFFKTVRAHTTRLCS